MIYIFLIYLAFLAVYDHWATPGVNWQITYFTAQYLFVIGVALTEIRRGKYVLEYALIAFIFTTLIITELRCVNTSLENYEAMRSSPPALMFTAFVMITFLYLLSAKKWIGSNKILRGR